MKKPARHRPRKLFRARKEKIGQSPGALIPLATGEGAPVAVTMFEYGPGAFKERTVSLPLQLSPPPADAPHRWVNVDGIHDARVVDQFGKCFGIHPLVLEDVLNPSQRNKFEEYEGHLFIVLDMITYDEARNEFTKEKVSLVLGEGCLLSFQEKPGDVFEPVRKRIRTPDSRVRRSSIDYVAYRLMDCVVDHYFVVLEKYAERIERLELQLIEDDNDSVVAEIQSLKRELLLLLRAIWPLRDILGSQIKEDSLFFSEETRVFLRDVRDHVLQVTDAIATFRELVDGMFEVHTSNMSHRMNEVMKVLTIFATLFIPLTFIVGIYGMNFEVIPELGWKWAYPALWIVMISVAGAMLAYFRRKKWL